MMSKMTHQEKTTILEVYEPKRKYEYVKQELTDVQEEWRIHSRDVHTYLSIIDTKRWKIGKDREGLHNTVNQLDLARRLRTEQNTQPFQVRTEYSPRDTVCLVIKRKK